MKFLTLTAAFALAMAPAPAQLILDPGSYTSAEVGTPSRSGSSSTVTGGFDLTGAGIEIGGTNDQFHFHYQLLAGDFDVSVRLQTLSLADAWSRAGLMARENLTGGSRFAAALATPGRGGSFFQYRSIVPSLSTNIGSFPATYPNMWLRLRRAGTGFSGFASVDGVTWTPLGSYTITNNMPSMFVGLAVGSRNSNVLASASFRSVDNVVNPGPTVSAPNLDREPLGPSTRRSAFAISEIMYHPRVAPEDTNRSLEFIEIYNAEAYPENLVRHRLSGSIDFTFTNELLVQPGQFVVVARDPSFVQSHYGITGVLGPWVGATTNSLPGGGGLIRLRNPAGAVLVEVPYQSSDPWPTAADGSGHSLVLRRPSFGERSPKAWSASSTIDGSPGRDEPYGPQPLSSIVINELLANSDGGTLDFIELYNHSNGDVDLAGAWLTDEANVFKFQIPGPAIIPARGFLHFTQAQLGFSLSAGGERLYLYDAARTRVVDAVDYPGQASGVSSGRSPDGSPVFSVLASPTPGTANSRIASPPVVINEIMYNPITGQNNDEYIELYNRSSVTQNMSGWRLRGGISYNFPSNVLIAPGGYLVVAENVTNLLAHYGNLNSGNTVGNYSGSLANGGERIALLRTEPNIVPGTNGPVTNIISILICDVTYGDGGRWGNWSDGGGSSLELVDPDADIRQPANWADSDETSKGTWSNIELSGNLTTSGTTPLGSPVFDQLHIFQLGVGECLLDDVEVHNNTGPNLIPNPSFESGLTSWTLQGSHDGSTIENVGFSGNSSLHIRAASRGDNGANRIRSGTLSGLSTSSTNVILRCKVRWIRGWPEILLRLHGGMLEVSGRMSVPTNLGTPGAPNSRAVSNAGPAVYEVVHSPALPAANEPVVVTARAQDPDGIASLRIKYRLDAVTPGNFQSLDMNDTGINGDAIAGDGVYSGTLPGQVAGAAISFYLEASDPLGAANTFPQDVFPPAGFVRCFPSDAITKELLVRWGDRQMMGSFASYHLWGTLTNLGRWTARDDLNNAVMDGTFVYNNYRVIYNARPNFAGSPWHRTSFDGSPTNNAERMDYVCNFPEDDLFLGTTDTVIGTVGNPADGSNSPSDTSGQTEQTSYLFFREMGLQFNYRRYVHMFLNGNQRSIHGGVPAGLNGNFVMEDAQQPNGDMVEEWFPEETDGELFKIEDWFEFNDTATGFSNEDADLGRREAFINGKVQLNTAPYRFMWRRRAVAAGDSASDYENLFKIVDAISPTAAYTELNAAPVPDPQALNKLIDAEQWMRIIAVQHTVGNWDSYGYERGKNSYSYMPRGGRMVLWTWDIDFTLGLGHAATMDTFTLGADGDRRIQGMWSTPIFVRMYWRAFDDLVNGPWNNTYTDPIMDAKAAAMTANNVSFTPSALTNVKNFIRDRRNYLIGQLTRVNPPFTARATGGSDPNDNLVLISGTAPVRIGDIYLNGAYYPVTWTTATNWTARIVLQPGTNQLTFRGIRPDGTPTSDAPITTNITFNGTQPDPRDAIAFNEIMYNPKVPEASYVELWNKSTASFDLSGWEINGLDYTFPLGSIMTSGQYLVLAKNRAAFLTAYTNAVAFDQFNGNLDLDGETLTLFKPGTDNAPDIIIDQVRYEARLPWATDANGSGASLQVIDPTRDNSRPSNWGDHDDWRYVTFTGINGINDTNFLIFLNGVGEIYIDDMVMVVGTVPNVGPNLIVNGDFESPMSVGPWESIGNHSNSVISTTVSHSGNASLKVVSSGVGSPSAAVRQITPPYSTPTNCTLSFYFLPTTNAPNVANPLVVRTRPGSQMVFQTQVRPVVATPGQANTGAAPLPAYDPLWLNEVQAENTSGPSDNFGQREPWLELFNAGNTPLDLSGYYLADNYDVNLLQWQFPPGSSIGPKEFKIVWADGQPGQTAGNNLHTSFRLNSTTGAVALVRLVSGKPQITDYLTYANLPAGQSYGDFPDGQPFHRQLLIDVTPGSTNVARFIDVVINEWMAANTNSVADPADGHFDDWFELYNGGTSAVDLGGFYLTDNPGSSASYFQIPTNGVYVIPPGGFLLVWADGEVVQNNPERPDLHVPFQLSRDGESLALYAPDQETVIDRIRFFTQTNDITEGRFPDGSPNIQRLGSPTPRSSNVGLGGNTPPQLAAIPSQTIRLGQTASFTASATDADVPAQTLTFDLPNAPVGASINPSSGLFTWTPTPNQAPSTNLLSVRVTDNGVPALSSSRPVTIIVLLPKTTITLNGSQIGLVFDTVPGKTYKVQFKNSLNDATWQDLTPPQTAAGTTLTATDSVNNSPQRFYRTVQLD
jgi:hypothetical protein